MLIFNDLIYGGKKNSCKKKITPNLCYEIEAINYFYLPKIEWKFILFFYWKVSVLLLQSGLNQMQGTEKLCLEVNKLR